MIGWASKRRRWIGAAALAAVVGLAAARYAWAAPSWDVPQTLH